MRSPRKMPASSALSFTSFATDVCAVVFYIAQFVLYRVLFDGIEPRDLPAQELEIARTMFGDIDRVPPGARVVCVQVKGARVGGTRFAALRLLHLALTLVLAMLAPGEAVYAIIVGPDTRLARQALSFVLGQARAVPSIAKRIRSVTSDSFQLERDDGRIVTFVCLPATAGGSAVRGRSIVGALLTEFAFFRSAEFVVNDLEIYRAILPRIVAGGQLIIESTPWAETGLLYDLHAANFGKPTSALVAVCPTLLMRSDARTAQIVAQERERDDVNASREFDAQFMSAGSGQFFDASTIDRAVDDSLYLPAPVPRGALVGSGIDLGLTMDSSTKARVARVGDVHTLISLIEKRPERSAPLKLSEVINEFADDGAGEWLADGWCRQPAKEWADKRGVTIVAAPADQAGKVATFVHLKKLFAEGRIKIPRDPRLIAQLKTVQARFISGGRTTIHIPRRGGHGDLVSALVLAVWATATTKKPKQDWGTRPIRVTQFEDHKIGGDHLGGGLDGPGYEFGGPQTNDAAFVADLINSMPDTFRK